MSTVISSVSAHAATPSVRFTVDFIHNTINGSEYNFKKAGITGTEQYEELMARMAAHPGFKLNPIKPKKEKKTYAGLSLELMKKYILIQDNRDKALVEYEALIGDGNSYPTIKSWFLETYKGFDVKRANEQIASHRLRTVKSRVRKLQPVSKSTSDSTLTLPNIVNK